MIATTTHDSGISYDALVTPDRGRRRLIQGDVMPNPTRARKSLEEKVLAATGIKINFKL